MELTKENEESVTREIDAHGEALKTWIGAGCCPWCHAPHRIELNERNITFRCSHPACGWSAIYPIRTLGNSERAERDEELDQIATAERSVLRAAKEWAAQLAGTILSTERKLANAVTLLESQEAATKHLNRPITQEEIDQWQ